MMTDLFDLVRGSEKEGAMNAENSYVGRNFLMLKDVNVSFSQILVSYLGYRGRNRDFPYEHESRQNHPCFHRHGQIREYRERECNQPGTDLQRRELQKLGYFPPFSHVVG